MMYKSVIQELKINFKEHFETEFAAKLLHHKEILKVVNKISQMVLQLINANKQAAINLANTNKKIAEELLHENYFGHFSCNMEAPPTSEELISLICKTLAASDADLIHVMQIHCVFIQRFYDSLPSKNLENKQEYVKKVFTDNLFAKRDREEISVLNKLTKIIGINRNLFFKNKSEKTHQHFPAINKFIPIKESEYFRLTTESYLPFVSGPSGHTGSLLLLASLCELNPTELQIYALACFAFLACGGNHSFHEVMIVAQNLGIPFVMGNYAISIPSVIKNSSLYDELKELFPDFLMESENLKEENYVARKN